MATTEQTNGRSSTLPADRGAVVDDGDDAYHCDFRLSPPPHFHYPAILLLLSEEPRHGYALVDALRALDFGPISRPSVYRALGDLEHDGFLVSWDAAPLAGSTRHVYAVTDAGQAQLTEWMEIVGRERDALEAMTDRFVRGRDRGRTDRL
ncbi:MAG: PadR family transcriptional regulator [Iamia sp.]